VALSGINFKIMPGEVIALVGENGAGKSTLMNILFGMDIIHKTGGFEGTILLDGEETQIFNPMDAIQKGIGMVHQEFMLIPQFTVTQNIKINRELLRPNILSSLIGKEFDTLDKKAMYLDAQEALDRVGIEVSPDDRIGMMPIGIKQFVEISREIDKKNLKLLIFDEPTAALTETEATKLLECIRSIAADGVSIIFITHRLDEVMQVADRVVVLRDGQLAGNQVTSNLTKENIAELMVGRPLTEALTYKDAQVFDDNDIILEFRDVSIDMPGEKLRHVNMRVRRGEIFGLGGLAGHGKMAISNAGAGMYPSTGEILFDGEPLLVNKTGRLK
jgi:simple sugar transport system ATP-binding protein